MREEVAIFRNIYLSEATMEEKQNAIRKVIKMETHNSFTKQEFINALDWLLNKHPKQDSWIHCSERLPERNTNVIAQFSSGVVSELLFNEKGLFQGIYEYGPNVIVAWQPLPQPYKPQESEWKNKVMKHFTNVE